MEGGLNHQNLNTLSHSCDNVVTTLLQHLGQISVYRLYMYT